MGTIIANTSLKRKTPYLDTPLQQNISALPSEMLINIFEYLHIKSAVDLGLTSRTLYHYQKAPSLWKFFCIRDFFSDVPVEKRQLPSVHCTWKTYYQQFENFLLLPFPGKSASFKAIPSEDWHIDHSGSRLIRRLSFKSETPGSLFEEFTLLGYEGGDVALSLTISEDLIEIVKPYFKALAFKDKQFGSENFLLFTNSDDKRKIFKVLRIFNRIDENSLNLAERLAFCTRWDSVTPLTPEEIQKYLADKEAYQKSFQPKTWGEWVVQKLIIDPLFGGILDILRPPKIFPTVLDG